MRFDKTGAYRRSISSFPRRNCAHRDDVCNDVRIAERGREMQRNASQGETCTGSASSAMESRLFGMESKATHKNEMQCTTTRIQYIAHGSGCRRCRGQTHSTLDATMREGTNAQILAMIGPWMPNLDDLLTKQYPRGWRATGCPFVSNGEGRPWRPLMVGLAMLRTAAQLTHFRERADDLCSRLRWNASPPLMRQ